MPRAKRVLRAILLAILILPPLAAGGIWLWLRLGLPDYEGTVRLPGLSATVEIVRDGNAVPHIFAQSAEDAYFALGWVHAQDRLWQMEMHRRVGAGRLSELIGPAGLSLDRHMRTLGLYRLAERSYDSLAPEVRATLDAYAAGVNAWLERRSGPLPLEFQLLRAEPEPWRPADSLVWGKLMALQLSTNMRDELLRARMLQRLTPNQIEVIDPAYPHDAPTTLPAELAGLDFERFAAVRLPELGPSRASNEWVVAGDGTNTGRPILANDPHLGLAAPILWYLARIEAPGLSLTGATVPGVPFHILGHNGRIAWGLTTTGTDVQDLFVERVVPGEPDRYLTPDGPQPFTVREEVIRIEGAEPETLRVRLTRHGPVISDIDGRALPLLSDNHVLALAWTGLTADDTTAEALYRVNRATSWPAFRAALRRFQVPQQNWVYADVEGNIGFITPGLVPIRRQGDGLVPVPGWTGEYAWSGYIPFDALPQGLNPPAGRFVNANNKVVGPDYPYLITKDWDDPFRATRIEQVLSSTGPHSLDAAEALLADTVNLPARMLLPLFLADTEAGTERGRAALALLRDWDGRMLRDRPEPLIFEWWLREVNRQLYADELDALFPEVWHLNPRTVETILTGHRDWCDDVRTAQRAESCGDALGAALETALEALADRHGAEMAEWRWGAEHRAPLENQILDRVPILGELFAIGVETDGSYHTVNRGAFRLRDDDAPFAHTHGAGYRAVYDLAALDRSLFVITTGQSGNPLSPHYGDFVETWRSGRHIRIGGDREALAASGLGRLILSPAEGPR